MNLDNSTDISQLSADYNHDSEADTDMEIRMYSELYFEPNPDYVPLPNSSSAQLTTVPSKITSNSEIHQTDRELNIVESNSSQLHDSSTKYTAELADNSNVNPVLFSSTPKSGSSGTDLKQSISRNCVSISTPVMQKPTKYVSQSSSSVLKDDPAIKPQPYIHRTVSNSYYNNFVIDTNPQIEKPSTIFSTPKNSSASLLRKSIKRSSTDGGIVTNSTKKRMRGNAPDVVVISSDEETPSSQTSTPASRNGSVQKNNVSSFLSEFKKKVGVISPTIATPVNNSRSRPRRKTNITYVANESCSSDDHCAGKSMMSNINIYNSTTADSSQSSDEEVAHRTPTRTFWPLDYSRTRSAMGRSPAVDHWTPHMTSFYDSDFSDEYDIKHLHNTMTGLFLLLFFTDKLYIIQVHCFCFNYLHNLFVQLLTNIVSQ